MRHEIFRFKAQAARNSCLLRRHVATGNACGITQNLGISVVIYEFMDSYEVSEPLDVWVKSIAAFNASV